MTPEEELQDAISECYADPLKYVMIAFEWGEGELKEQKPDKWQAEFLNDLGKSVKDRRFDGVNSVDPVKMSTSSGHDIGKSALAAWIILWIMSTRPYCKGTVSASTLPQLESKTWPELAKWWKRSINSHWFDWTGSRNNLKFFHKAFPEEWFCAGQSSREENAEAFAGQHARTSTSFYLFDESSGIPDSIRIVAEGGLTDGEPMLFAFGNPTKNTGWFYESVFGDMNHRYETRCIDSREVSIANKRLLKEWMEDYGEDSDTFRVRARGLPPRASDHQFIDKETVNMSVNRLIEIDPGASLITGVDVARFGDNKTVIATRQGRDARSIPMQKYASKDTMEIAAKVALHIDRYKPDAVLIDDAGVGGGVVDRLKQLRYRVIGVNPGGRAVDSVRYANIRAEAWDAMKAWLQTGSIPNDPVLIKGLISPEFDFNAVNKLKLESKDMMARRGVDSPDEADALSFTFAQPIKRRDVRDVMPMYANSKYQEI